MISWRIALRYLFSKKKSKAVYWISRIAIIGISICTFALYVVLSVFAGIEDYVALNSKNHLAQILISPTNSKHFIVTDSLTEQLNSNQHIQEYSYFVSDKAFIQYQDKNHPIKLVGIHPSYSEIITIDTALIAGDYLAFESDYELLLGDEIAYRIQYNLNDIINPFNLLVPNVSDNITEIANGLKIEEFRPIGIFSLENEINKSVCYVPIEGFRKLYGSIENKASGVVVKLQANSSVADFKNSIRLPNFKIEDRKEQNAVFYKLMKTESLITYMLFTLILLLSLFTLTGAIVMLVLEKKQNIQSLSTIGMSINQVRTIFFYYGLWIVGVGILIGMSLAILLILVQQFFSIYTINNGTMPYPISLSFWYALEVICTVFICGSLFSAFAALKVKNNS